MKMDNLCALFLFFILSLCANIVTGIDIARWYRLQTVRVSNEVATATSEGSLAQCAAQCSQNDDCWVAQWHENNELCEMFDYRLTITLVYPIDPGNSTVLFGSPISGKYSDASC